MSGPLRCTPERDRQLWRLVFDRPKANIIDREMVGAIRDALKEVAAEPAAKLVVFEGEGKHFSFGASVEEHLPGQVDKMLPDLHQLFRDIEATNVPTAGIVRGQCLGGGLEVALWCSLIWCDPSAQFGVPEVKLGVFPPMGSLGLPWRVGGPRATRMVLTGESVDGKTAEGWGLADFCVDDPEAALQSWFDEHFAPKSAVALRMAYKAVRRPLALALEKDLPEIEKIYLEQLMSHEDPAEGLRSFTERRKPAWKHR